MTPRSRPARLVAPLLLAGLAACSTGAPTAQTVPAYDVAPAGNARPSSAAAVRAQATMLPCPTTNIAPDPKRPVLTAAVSFGSDGIVSGTQRVVFTPDLATGQIYFRLWAAGPKPRAAGGSIVVSKAVVNGRARTMERPSPTVLRIPLVGKTPAGTAVTIDLTWRMKLPTGINDRFGRRGETQWFGSGMPLLNWERRKGWALERETSSFAESSTSEAMQLASLSVTRAQGLGVLSTGAPVSDNGTTAVFKARSVRDVAVAVGRFSTRTVMVDSMPVVVGVAPGVSDSAATVANELARSIKVHRTRFGPFPYERLAAAVVPDLTGGIEYPGMILLGKGQAQDATASHEVAHEWFYGLVGNNQGRDPWLDESFGTYAEGLDRGTLGSYERTTIPADGRNRVGAPMTYWEGRSSYYRSVYVQGAAALAKARRAVGAAAFDKAIGCHVRRNAHRITTPADLAASLRHLPAAVAELKKVGALP
ncbi:MAG: M1 family aminopeptidase [Mycobacteriales bacterium]|nr:M1 family aminopeptidase [Mycobacteriales bacterium]